MRYLTLLLTLCLLISCSEKSAIQKAAGVSAEQGRAIEDTLLENGIEYETIVSLMTGKEFSENDCSDRPYEITDREGNMYTIYLFENTLVIIRDADGNVIYESR